MRSTNQERAWGSKYILSEAIRGFRYLRIWCHRARDEGLTPNQAIHDRTEVLTIDDNDRILHTGYQTAQPLIVRQMYAMIQNAYRDKGVITE
jgi:hypothetical protein